MPLHSHYHVYPQIHPDLNPNDPTNHEKFIQLNEAYTVLSKPLSRQEYDTSLSARLYYEDTLFKHGYHSYTAGETSHPGTSTYADEGDGLVIISTSNTGLSVTFVSL